MMPFFLVQNKKSNPYCPYKKTAKINTTAPLQVQMCIRDRSKIKANWYGILAKKRQKL